MAAAVAVLETLADPDRPVAIVEDGYYGVRRAAEDLSSTRGKELVLLPSRGAQAVPAIETAQPGLVWVESPTNPGLNVTDLRAVAEATVKAGGVLVFDDTVVTPRTTTVCVWGFCRSLQRDQVHLGPLRPAAGAGLCHRRGCRRAPARLAKRQRRDTGRVRGLAVPPRYANVGTSLCPAV